MNFVRYATMAKLGDNGIFDVNNNIHCADDGVGVDDDDCSDLSEGADGVE